jgi:hypothetical protein
LEGNEDEEEE